MQSLNYKFYIIHCKIFTFTVQKFTKLLQNGYLLTIGFVNNNVQIVKKKEDN